ncbi:aldo/keto reductase [Paenibacillus nasutitermitis]|uniref:NADP-dependent oxidoreductase domain-containing protein n=1 Tax=Paenibacillus nasutitermitis TaxID=1652958 RepID=A0A917DTA8_9BACL|nr:aldo/keto reductase [Paenibacillus nasutitermitis]GGD66852.1 hypothetical protein GCM10010911_25770 [Paenibacillus nasutitermitis]
MNPIKIEGTDLAMLPIALGTADYGTGVSREQSFRMMDQFVEGGGSVIDSARVYADWLPDGHGMSEKTVGDWLKTSGKRKQILLSTKGAHPRLSAMDVPRMSPQDIAADLEESLTALGVDEIDLYWLHRDDRSRPVGEILETLNQLKRDGKIRHFGCSNWRSDRIEEAAAYARIQGLTGFAASQIQWNLGQINEEAILDPTMVIMDETEQHFHRETGMALFAFTSQARGFFQKMEAGGVESLRESTRSAYYNEINLGRLRRAVELSRQLSVSISVIVLSYLTSQPFPVIPVIGSQTPQQVNDALAAVEVRLTPAMVKYLEEG